MKKVNKKTGFWNFMLFTMFFDFKSSFLLFSILIFQFFISYLPSITLRAERARSALSGEITLREMRSSTNCLKVKPWEEDWVDGEEVEDDLLRRERVIGPTAPTWGRLFLAWYFLTASLVIGP